MAVYVPATSGGGIYQSGAGSGVSGINLVATDFTLTAWVRIRSSSTGHFPIFAQGDCASTLNGVFWQINSAGGYRLITGQSSGSTVMDQATTNIIDEPSGLGSWMFYAVTHAGPARGDWVAGYQVSAANGRWNYSRKAGGTGDPTAPSSVSTNVLSDTVTHTAGAISDLRVFNYVLNQAELRYVAVGKPLGTELYRGYCLGSIGFDLSSIGNHIAAPTGTNVTRVPDPVHLQGGRIFSVFTPPTRRRSGIVTAAATGISRTDVSLSILA